MNKAFNALEKETERVLKLGQYISYNSAWDFVEDLEKIDVKIKTFQKNNPKESVVLYELFLSGCYEKFEEIDDSGDNLGMFIDGLFCDWIDARQKAKADPEETIKQILNWMENDNYGVTYNLEKDIVKVLRKKELEYFKNIIQDRFNAAIKKESPKRKQCPDFSANVRNNADILKEIFKKTKNIAAYEDLTNKIGMEPRDCRNFAEIYKMKKKWNEALAWVEKGLDLGKKGSFGSQYAYDLDVLKKDLLLKLGKKKDALQYSWEEYQQFPSEFTYEDFMKYVPNNKRGQWHKKAMEVAQKAPIMHTIDLFLKVKEYGLLKTKIDSATPKNIEELGHYLLEPVAEVLEKRKELSTAGKVYKALGMRIINRGKSKYYDIAIGHFSKLKQIYLQLNQKQSWMRFANTVKKNHSRKKSFMEDFEKIIHDIPVKPEETVSQKLRNRWQKQIS
ncbi:DUF6880 family protein [Fibrobacterota bacterium]